MDFFDNIDDKVDWDFESKPNKKAGSFINGNVEMPKTFSDEKAEENDFGNMKLNSTAIDDVKYDPNSNTASAKWINGDKYYDFDVSPSEMQDFSGAISKGQYVNNVWKNYNRKS